MSESVMMTLANDLGRQAAHDAVDAMVRQSVESGVSFAEVVAERAPHAVDGLDPAGYLGRATDQVDAVLAEAGRVLARYSATSKSPNENHPPTSEQ